jgi:GNAT superfamily N-acetyltransferase
VRRSSVEVALAVTRAERDAASRLVHRCYLRRGYVKPSADGRHASPHLAMPSTAVFVARADGGIVGTVSLIPDSARRLPCDGLWGAELAELRANGRQVAEVSALAVSEAWRGTGLLMLRALVRAVGVYGRDIARLDTLCIAVLPRHAPFYESLLRFRRFGGPRLYAAVNTHAVGLRLDLRQLDGPLDDAFASEVFTAEARRHVRASLHDDLRRRASWRRLKFLHTFRRADGLGDMQMC